MWQKLCVYFTSICMLGGSLHWAFFFTLTAQVVSFDVYALDELKEELDAKYQLDTPQNVDGTDLYQKILDNKDKGPEQNPTLEIDILNRSAGAGTSVDTSQYDDIDFHQEFEKYMDQGVTGTQPKAPTMTDGNIDVEYYEKAGVKLSRDDNDNLIYTTVPESERGAKITSIKSSEVFTNQQTRSDEEFNAPSNYGDEEAYIDDLKVQYEKASDGKTMNSEAYRAIMQSNVDNPAPKISHDAYFFAETNQAISDAQNGEGIWAQSCVDETVTETTQKQIPVWEQKICQRPNHQNFDFCEVTRELELNPEYEEGVTPRYIESYVQYPEGCADKVGWKPLCPEDTTCIYDADPDIDNETSLLSTKSMLATQSASAAKSMLTTQTLSATPTSASSSASNDASDSIEQRLIQVDRIQGESHTAHPSWRPGPGYVKEMEGIEWMAISCSEFNSSTSTCLMEKIPCEKQTGIGNAFEYSDNVTYVTETEEYFQKKSLESGELYGVEYVIEKDEVIYTLSECEFNNYAHGLFSYSCTATPRVSELCQSNVCPSIPACPTYIPEAEFTPFCSFSEWEIIEQGTNQYSQDLITRLPKMFETDPNPATLYGGDNEGEGQYHVATWKINAKNYSCDPLKGNDYCTQVLNPTTLEYEEQCYSYSEFKDLEGSCGQYESNDRCEKTGDSCGEGWYDEVNDICYMYTDTYQCDVSTPFETTKTTTSNVCAGMLPCMGNGCAYGEEETSDDFEKAVLMGSIAQTVDDDSTCASEDPDTCEIFPGESEYCSWEVSGLGNNCCEAPEGVNYLELAALGYKMMQTETFKNVSSTLSGGVTDQIGGLYTDFSSMLVDGWNSGATAVVDFTSSIMGDPDFMQGVSETVQLGGSTAEEAVSGIMHTMQQQVYSFLNNALPEELAGMLFQEATDKMVEDNLANVGDTVLSDGASQFMSIISFVGMLYTIYNMVKLLANLLTQCDDNESDVGVKLAQKQCFAVGKKYCAKKVLGVCYVRRQDWCCYSSMLSRIIADQGSKQLGKDMSSCPGFTIEEFGRIDFDQLDLSEWLSTMYEADILSTSGYDIDRLTGSGRMVGNLSCEGSDDPDCEDMERKNANERAVDQFDTDVSNTTNELKETFDPEQIDCSVYPRPLICEMKGN
ncbi:conjugal transfer protein TraN [Shewanella algicola]|uniref:Conjugal transfer protein TraN n=1 Tax=Shewanella algicola TaxID=640633 RepID=A0A9X1ZA22_9GAMM|nr:conjugal transfer protein TraN [Shewanella algicola]MCL1107752.1 conjugal transfer protein TraN [Shewanella algicola]